MASSTFDNHRTHESATCPDCGSRLFIDQDAKTSMTWRRQQPGTMPYLEEVLRPAVVAFCTGCEFAIEIPRDLLRPTTPKRPRRLVRTVLAALVLAMTAIAAPSTAADRPADPEPTARPSLALRAEAVDPVYRVGQLSIVAANLADIGTTLVGWQHGQFEQNPLIGGNNVGRLLAVKSLTVGGQLLLMHWLAKTGHPRAAGWVGLGSSAPPALAALHNARLNGAAR